MLIWGSAYVVTKWVVLEVPPLLFAFLRFAVASTILAALYLGAGPSALAYLLWNQALRHLDAGQAANFLNLIPVVGIASAAFFLGEVPTPGQLLGGSLVVGGVWLSSRDP